MLIAATMAACATGPFAPEEEHEPPVLVPYSFSVVDYQDVREHAPDDMPYQLKKAKLMDELATFTSRQLFSPLPAALWVKVNHFKAYKEKKKYTIEMELMLEARTKDVNKLLTSGTFYCKQTNTEPFELDNMVRAFFENGKFTNAKMQGKLWEEIFTRCVERIANDFNEAILNDGQGKE